MEEVFSRFSHLGEEIFDLLDEESIKNCKKVSKTWKNFIESPNQKVKWIQIIRNYGKQALIGDNNINIFISP